jgi:hypothetical protein
VVVGNIILVVEVEVVAFVQLSPGEMLYGQSVVVESTIIVDVAVVAVAFAVAFTEPLSAAELSELSSVAVDAFPAAMAVCEVDAFTDDIDVDGAVCAAVAFVDAIDITVSLIDDVFVRLPSMSRLCL